VYHRIESMKPQTFSHCVRVQQIQFRPGWPTDVVLWAQALGQIPAEEASGACNEDFHQQVLPPSITRFEPVI
jgi:hypothetical protein